jgi:hypothetical protein
MSVEEVVNAISVHCSYAARALTQASLLCFEEGDPDTGCELSRILLELKEVCKDPRYAYRS